MNIELKPHIQYLLTLLTRELLAESLARSSWLRRS